MGLTEDDAAIIQDELGSRGAAVGTPEHLGGVAYDKLGITGFGVAEAAHEASNAISLPIPSARMVIQGFGAVGAAAAERFRDLGASVVAVSTSRGVVHCPTGLDVDELLAARQVHGDDLVRHVSATTRPRQGRSCTWTATSSSRPPCRTSSTPVTAFVDIARQVAE